MKNNIVVGIDPGKHGAIAILNFDVQPVKVDVYDLTPFYDGSGASGSSINTKQFTDWVKKYIPKKADVCCEEPIYLGFGFTSKTTMSTFESFGCIRGVFSSLGYSFTSCPPKEWISYYQKEHGAVPKKKEKKRDKTESMMWANEYFPHCNGIFFNVRGGREVFKDGRAEAALIANFKKNKKF